MKKFSRVKQVEVGTDNPHEYDALDREEDCISLVDLIRNSEPPFTLAVDAEWGNGKSVFIEMLRVHLTRKGFRSVLFNAWKCDFCEEPVAPLIVEISGELPENSPARRKIRSMGNSLLRVLKVCGPLMPGPAPVVFNVLDELVSGKTERGSSGSIGDYEEYRNALEGFRDSLEKFASEDGEGRPFVVFIDDLDRCRPDFAVKTLERVKHIFDVASLFFVIAVNKKELGGIVKSFYGCEDGERYLEKFFDLVFHLRSRKTLIGSSLAEIRFDRFQEKVKKKVHIEIDEATHRRWITTYLESLSGSFGFTLRVQEKLVKMVEITFDRLAQVLDEDYYEPVILPAKPKIPSVHMNPIQLHYPVLCYFLALRVANPDLFHRSAESRNAESVPWEEHIRFYLEKLGRNEELRMDSVVNTSSLETIASEESRVVALCLVALFNLPGGRSFNQLNLSGEIKEKLENIVDLMKINDHHFDTHFRKFLGSIDFAGSFYEPEDTNETP